MSEDEPVPHPDVEEYLNSLVARPPAWEPPLADRRCESKAEVIAECGDPERVASVEDVRVGGVPLRVYRPCRNESNVLVWMHGGGWVFHDVAAFDSLTRALANEAGCAVASVDYRLAPEHRFPAGLEDCWAATQWAARSFDRVAVGGDSAGGNLAAAVALRARDADLRLALQLLVYAVTDFAVDSEAYDRFRARYQRFAGKADFGAQYQDGIRWLWEQYIPDSDRRADPEASPLRAFSMAGVAPALIVVGEHDILLGENEAYARRLESDLVPVELAIYPGQIHGFFHRLAVMDDARSAVEQSAVALRRAFE